MTDTARRALPGHTGVEPRSVAGDHSSSRDWRLVSKIMPLFLLAAAVAVNLWWIETSLRGMPFDIDAAGYLQRAIRDGDALRTGGIGAYISAVRTPGDIQAPLLTAFAGVLQGILGLGVLKLTGLVQVFYVITIVASYAIARRLLERRWALLAAIVVASMPAVLQASRDFDFSVPAAAMFTTALALQLGADDFDSLPRAVLWGVALGLASLARTMILAFLPALVLMALPRLARGDRRLRRSLHLIAGLAAGFVVAISWYSVTWRSVLHYLVSYGYGANASHYGSGSSWLSTSHWTARANIIVNEDLFLPLTLALALSVVVGTCYAVVRRAMRERTGSMRWATPRRRRLASWFLDRVSSDVGTLAGVVLICYVVLSSTQNGGSYFELPLLPAIVVLALWIGHHVTGRPRAFLAMASLLAAALSFANQAGWLLPAYSQVESVQIGTWSTVAFDSRGTLVRYAAAVLGGCPGVYTCISPDLPPGTSRHGASQNTIVNSYLRSWVAPVDAATRWIESFARAHGRAPVLFFAVQDPFFNTNTVQLEAQIVDGAAIPMGILQPPRVAKTSYQNQLEAPQYGEPNLVIEGPLPGNPYSAAFSPDNHESQVVHVLRAEGFTRVHRFTLPDHREISIWWKERGATVPS